MNLQELKMKSLQAADAAVKQVSKKIKDNPIDQWYDFKYWERTWMHTFRIMTSSSEASSQANFKYQWPAESLKAANLAKRFREGRGGQALKMTGEFFESTYLGAGYMNDNLFSDPEHTVLYNDMIPNQLLVAMHLKTDKVDIFHGLSHELPHGIPHSIKRVVTMHDLIVWRYPQYYRPFDRLAHRVKQRHSCRIADAVVAISESTKQDLIKYMHVPESKIHVIYQSCDPIFWQPITVDERHDITKMYHLPEKYVVCVGTIEERKNQRTVVKAIAKLPQDIHLVIVGRQRGRYYYEVMSEIKAQKLTNRVHFVSNADFEDFPALYANAIASVYMSHFEGFGIPILESMCCDTPVVTSNVSSMPEAGGDAALYASPDNPDEVAQQLMRIIEDPNLRADLVAKGRVQREKFSQKKVIADLYNLYTTLVPQDEDDF